MLVVEDHAFYRAALARAIRQSSGLGAIEAPSAIHALTILGDRDDIGVIVADERFPVGPQGSVLLEEAGRRWPHVRRMLLTAYSTGQMVADAEYPVLDKALSLFVILGQIETLAYERDSD